MLLREVCSKLLMYLLAPLCLYARYSVSSWSDRLQYYQSYIQAHINDCNSVLKMPLLVEEFGPEGTSSPFGTLDKRNQVYNSTYSIMLASAKSQGAGAGKTWDWIVQYCRLRICALHGASNLSARGTLPAVLQCQRCLCLVVYTCMLWSVSFLSGVQKSCNALQDFFFVCVSNLCGIAVALLWHLLVDELQSWDDGHAVIVSKQPSVVKLITTQSQQLLGAV